MGNNRLDRERKKNNENERKNSTIIIFILIVITIISLFGISRELNLKNSKMGYVSLNPINVTIPSNNENHTISIKLTLGGKNKKLNKLNIDDVQFIAKEAIKKMEYKNVVSKDGNDYIKKIVLQELKEQFGTSIEQVNIDSILTDITVNEKPAEGKLDKVLDGVSWSKNK